MEKLYSGAALDGLLKILVDQGGDNLLLETNKKPVALCDKAPVRLTVPPTSNTTLRALCGQMANRFVDATEGDPPLKLKYQCNEGLFFAEVSLGASDTLRIELKLEKKTDEEEKSKEAASSSGPRAELSSDLSGLIFHALERGASDLHLTDNQPARIRIAGKLSTLHQPIPSIESLLTAEQLKQVKRGESVDWAQDFQNSARLRLNAFLTAQGLCCAIRVLPMAVPRFEQLGLPEEVLALSRAPHGLILICGHTGAGKSTTLAAFTQALLLRQPGLCITLEAPIEYDLSDSGEHSLVRQREVGTHVESFSTGLRDALREDPDILFVGEMRDAETAQLALTAAETGHLVLSSLHSRTAVSTIQRIVDFFPAIGQAQIRAQLADCLRAVVSQRLLPPRIQGRKRVVAAEVLTINAAAAHLIREGKTEQLPTIIQAGKEAGMLPLERDLGRLVNEQRVEKSVARAAANHPTNFDRFCAPSPQPQ